MYRQSLFKLIRLLISLGLLGLVVYLSGLFEAQGRAEFVAQLRGADPVFLLISVLAGIVVNMSSALKWHWLARANGLVVGYWRIFSYYVIGQFYNLFLPTSVGGDVVRSYELGRFTGNQSASLASVFVERYTGVVTLLVFAFMAFFIQLSIFNVDFVVVSLVFFALVLALIAWVVFDPRPYLYLRRYCVLRWTRLESLFVKLDKLVLSINDYRNQPKAIYLAFFNSVVFYALATANVFVSSLVFEPQVQWLHALAATPIIMLIMNIPLSVGNIGLMEFAYTSVFALLGYDPALGLSIALLMRAKSLIDGAMGGVLQPFFVTQSSN